MTSSLEIEYSIGSTGPGGAEYTVYLPNGQEWTYMISDRDCAILRRNREDTLEHYLLRDLSAHFPELECIVLVRR